MRDIIHDIIKAYKTLKKHWYIIFGVALLCGIVAGLAHKKTSYVAITEVFLTERSHKSSDFFVSDSYRFEYSDSHLSSDEFKFIIKSSRVIDSVLTNKIHLNGKYDLVSNHLISPNSIKSSDEIISSKKSLWEVKNFLKNSIETKSPSNNLIRLEVQSFNDSLAIFIAKELINETKKFVMKIGLENEIKLRSKLLEKRDSLSISQPTNQNLLSKINLQFEVSELKIARFNSNIKIISKPEIPLPKSGFTKMILVTLFCLFGFFFSSLLVLVANYVRNNI